MRTTYTVSTVLFACVALAACGSSSSDNADSGIIIFADAAVNDAGSIAACNPVENTGCGPNEKCSKLNQTDTLSRTTCVPDGTVPRGGMCEWGDPGPDTGFDNCEAKNYCRNGVCREICDSAPDSCSTGNCVQIYNTFDETEGVGVCAEPCDPVTQDCSVDTEGCYLNTNTGKSSCSRIPDEAVGLTQDDDCYGPEPGRCYLNGCDEGYAPILNKGGPDGPGGSVCAAFCSPVAQNSTNFDQLGGVAPNNCAARGAVSHECRFIQSFYSNTQNVAATIGFCVPPDLWLSCANYVPGDENSFVPGCEPLMMAGPAPKGKRPVFKGDMSALIKQGLEFLRRK